MPNCQQNDFSKLAILAALMCLKYPPEHVTRELAVEIEKLRRFLRFHGWRRGLVKESIEDAEQITVEKLLNTCKKGTSINGGWIATVAIRTLETIRVRDAREAHEPLYDPNSDDGIVVRSAIEVIGAVPSAELTVEACQGCARILEDFARRYDISKLKYSEEYFLLKQMLHALAADPGGGLRGAFKAIVAHGVMPQKAANVVLKRLSMRQGVPDLRDG